MVVAGGALAATACSGSTAAQGDAAASEMAEAGSDASAPGDAGDTGLGFPESGGCCNASADPCCPLSCMAGSGPDASSYVSCEATWQECLMSRDADAIEDCRSRLPNGDASAPTDAATQDAGPVDAGSVDAAQDAPGD
jgi:hypothetical protein